MLSAFLLLLLLGPHPAGPAAALVIAAVVCCAAAMGGDNLQDLKTGHIVGATPWKQQIMQVVGVLAAAIVIAPVLAVLEAKYGIGVVSPAHPQPLAAPQATLMASLALGVFGHRLPWGLIGLGAGLAVLVVLLDRHLSVTHARIRVPPLAVALGMYLPFTLSTTILLGGCLAWLARPRSRADDEGLSGAGVIVSAGLVTGEALMGIVLAAPIALTGVWPSLRADPMRLFDQPPLGSWPGVIVLACVGLMLWRVSRSRTDRPSPAQSLGASK